MERKGVQKMNLNYKVLKKSNKNMARLGEFTTKWGLSKTPMFMPVGTQATVKTLNPEELIDAKANVILSNTYHLWLRPGEDVVKKAGGLHTFMNYKNGPILTDSGGFQVFSLAKKKDIHEEGVYFKSHIDGSKLFLSPEKSIEVQNKLSSVRLPTPYPMAFRTTFASTTPVNAKEHCIVNTIRINQATGE